jgi:hypothetical protein
MFADLNLVFWGTSPYSTSSFYSIGLTNSTASPSINLTTPEDMGIGDGEAVPKLAMYIGTGFTAACTSMGVNFQFQGSTNNTAWTTYVETGPLVTSSLTAGQKVFPIDVPHRPPGAALPQYYRLNIGVSAGAQANGDLISGGTIWAGLVIQRDDSPVGLYKSGFTVV